MNPQIIYCITAVFFLVAIIFLHIKYNLLNDVSTATVKPFSYARVQLAWWTFIVMSIMVAIMIASGQIPTLTSSSLILLGLGALTTGTARMIDISDSQNAPAAGAPTTLSVNGESQGFILDLISDNSGVSIHRLQAVIFNLIFGAWFIYGSFMAIKGAGTSTPLATLSAMVPKLEQNNLILLGLSAGTYAALKTTENKSTSNQGNAGTP